MEPLDLVPSGYRFLPTAEELVVDYLANWVAGLPLPGRAVAFADVYGTEPWNLLGDRQEAFFFTERKPKSSGGSRVDRKAGSGSWTLNKRQESIIDGREMMVGRKSCLSFNDGRRKYSGWTMYEYELCSSGGFERRVLCHVKKSSHKSIAADGTSIKTVDSTLSEAGTKTVTDGSFVGQKRNREESSSLSAAAAAPTLSKKPCWGLLPRSSDASPPPTAMVQHRSLVASAVTPPEGRLSSVDSVAPNEAGGVLQITVEELDAAFWASSSSPVDLGGEQNCTDDAFFTSLMPDGADKASTTIPEASASGLVDLLLMPDDTRTCEQMYCTDDHLMSDDTFATAWTTIPGLAEEQMDSTTPKEELQASLMYGTGTDSTMVAAASSPSWIDFCCWVAADGDDDGGFLQKDSSPMTPRSILLQPRPREQ
ncbi:hypothetical protein GW17_00061898 [Ensete ventricosum]|nr:hypothetical protein GW17_00061898 [Ensete ventricosum]